MLNLATILLLPMLIASSPSSMYTYTVQEESWISLSGSSNVNTFDCYSNSNVLNGNLIVTTNGKENALSFTNALLKLNIKSFDCKNPMLNKDLYKTLGAEETPFITIELIDALTTRQMEVNRTIIGKMTATIAVTINNKCKMVEIPITWHKVGATSFRFTGSKELNMSDFDISPPTAAFGLIRVHNQISINFSLVVSANSIIESGVFSENL